LKVEITFVIWQHDQINDRKKFVRRFANTNPDGGENFFDIFYLILSQSAFLQSFIHEKSSAEAKIR
jgi:hypothetical protein